MEVVFYAVHELTLSGNPLHCNCRLGWLRRLLRLDRKHDIEAIECVSPRSRRFEDISDEDFRCVQPSKPTLQYKELDFNRSVHVSIHLTQESHIFVDSRFLFVFSFLSLLGQSNNFNAMHS